MKKDHIETLYGELETFSKEPPKELWDNIEAKLHPRKKKRRGIIFLWGSAAAVLVLLVGYIITGSPEPINKPAKTITDIEYRTDKDTIKVLQEQASEISNEAVIKEDASQQVRNNPKELIKDAARTNQLSEKSEILKKEAEVINVIKNKPFTEEKSQFRNSYAQNLNKNNNDNRVEKTSLVLLPLKTKKFHFYDYKIIAEIDIVRKVFEIPSERLAEEFLALNENSSDDIDSEIAKSPKWSVEVLGGLSNTAAESSIQGASVNTTAQNDFVYTLKLGYAISDRLIIKSGIGKNLLGQEINNVLFTTDTSLSADNSQNIISNQNILFLGSQEAVNDFSTNEVNVSEGTLQQQFDYIQWPLEVLYDLLSEPTYNVSLGVGGHVNFLTNNNAFLNDEQIGESLGVSNTIFGATINSNISYKLTKKMNLFIEPSYNYFEKPIDNKNQNFKNTQFRALFGLRYKF